MRSSIRNISPDLTPLWFDDIFVIVGDDKGRSNGDSDVSNEGGVML